MAKKKKAKKQSKLTKIRDLAEPETDKIGRITAERQLLLVRDRELQQELAQTVSAIEAEVEGGQIQKTEQGLALFGKG